LTTFTDFLEATQIKMNDINQSWWWKKLISELASHLISSIRQCKLQSHNSDEEYLFQDILTATGNSKQHETLTPTEHLSQPTDLCLFRNCDLCTHCLLQNILPAKSLKKNKPPAPIYFNITSYFIVF